MVDSEIDLKIIIVGDSGVGKTCILLRFLEDTFSPASKATVGCDVEYRELVVDDTKVKLAIWDTAGQERFQSIAHTYYRGAHAAILVYDITNITSFSKLNTWLDEIRDWLAKETVTMVVGNKIDLEEQRQVAKQEGMDFAKKINSLFIETSAKESICVERAFVELVRKVLATPGLRESIQDTDVVNLKANYGTEEGTCKCNSVWRFFSKEATD